MTDPTDKPLIPRTAGGTTIAATVAGSLLAGVGFIGKEMVSLERKVGQGMERIDQSVGRVGDRIEDIEGDVDDLRTRVTILEDHQRTRLDREASTSH